ARGDRTAGLLASSISDASAQGSGRWGFSVERSPRAAPPRAGCCAWGRLRPRSNRVHWPVVTPPLAHSATRRAAAQPRVNLRLANGHSNGVAPGTHLPGGSSEEEDDALGPSTSRP
uniref:Uncharacterized protein n=1 Tax=Triticum urartu TaxID=4572 RepID=A0A8R7K258_TRIUA